MIECKPYLPANNPARMKRDATIAALHLQGDSMSQIAEQVGISKSQVCKVLSSPDVKAKVEAGLQAIVDLIPDATSVVRNTLRDSDNPALQFKAAEKVMDITGICGGSTQNVLIQQIYNDNRTTSIDPEVLQAFVGARVIS